LAGYAAAPSRSRVAARDPWLADAAFAFGVAEPAVRHVVADHRIAGTIIRQPAAVAGVFTDLLLSDSVILAGPLDAAFVVPGLLQETVLHAGGLLGGRIHTQGDAESRVRIAIAELRALVLRRCVAAADGGSAPGIDVTAIPDFAEAAGEAGPVSTLRRLEAELSSGHLLLPVLRRLIAEARILADDAAAIRPGDARSKHRATALLQRCGLLGAASTAAERWSAAQTTNTDTDTAASAFLADPAWLVIALSRILGRLTHPMPELPAPVLRKVADEARRRAARGRPLHLRETDGDQ
jgi:hypothetical protein